jgi:fucose 4-O-acetylase-like acetyltransferase
VITSNDKTLSNFLEDDGFLRKNLSIFKANNCVNIKEVHFTVMHVYRNAILLVVQRMRVFANKKWKRIPKKREILNVHAGLVFETK